MRLLNKFYSFIKSIYLNNSKYSNNLRHTLRIFFEREVKTKHTPTLFGSLFKGSKWVDYQTFNINKLFIKSGLSYFYYIMFAVLLLFVLLGRSKSEQYFGFLPFFSYINFVLGYVPILFSDLWSQLFFFLYILYVYMSNVFYRFISYFTTNLFKSLGEDTLVVRKNRFNSKNISTSNTTCVLTNNQNLTKNKLQNSPVSFSKHISKLGTSISTVSPNTILGNPQNPTTNYINTLNLCLKAGSDLFSNPNSTVTAQEASYVYGTLRSNTVVGNNYVKNLRLNLHSLYRLYSNKNYPLFFDFNTEKNLNNAKQQRWLVRNSLLTESIINNSFLITQAKKIIGLGTLGKDFTNKTLWLPTKASNLSSLESSLYLNNLSSNLLTIGTDNNNFLNQNHLRQSNFNNLNFFENSRLWVFKKYFFTNQQAHNLVTDNPIFLGNTANLVNVKGYDYTNLNFTTNIYTSNTLSLTNNNLTPSLVYNNSLLNAESYGGVINLGSTNLNLNNLDIISGSNTGFLFLLTSNPQDTPNSQNYFSNLKYTTTSNPSPLLKCEDIKFTQSK